MGGMTKPSRRGPGRPEIPIDRITDIAVQLVDQNGADALTIRGVAKALSSSTSTIYRHVKNRAELVALAVDRMLAEVSLPDIEDDDDLPWDVACSRITGAVFRTLSQHGRIAPLLIEEGPLGPSALALRDRTARALLRSGLGESSVALAVATLARLTLGFAMQEAAETVPSASRPADTQDFPYLARVAPYMPTPLADEFNFALTVFIRGLTSLPGTTISSELANKPLSRRSGSTRSLDRG